MLAHTTRAVMKAPRISQEIIQGYYALATPNVADALDRHSIKGMPRGLLPLYPTCKKLSVRQPQ